MEFEERLRKSRNDREALIEDLRVIDEVNHFLDPKIVGSLQRHAVAGWAGRRIQDLAEEYLSPERVAASISKAQTRPERKPRKSLLEKAKTIFHR